MGPRPSAIAPLARCLPGMTFVENDARTTNVIPAQAGTQYTEQKRFAINGAPEVMRRASARGHVHGSRASAAAPPARHLPGMTFVAWSKYTNTALSLSKGG
jgi:hypothetical protein